MNDAASFDAIMQCNVLEIFCEALDAAIFITDKFDAISFSSAKLGQWFPLCASAIGPGTRARELFAALFDAGCRLGATDPQRVRREDWIAERVALGWKEKIDTIEQSGPDRWFRVISRRFPTGLGITVLQDVSENKKREDRWRLDSERVRVTEQVLDSLPVAVAIKDRHLRYVGLNREFCEVIRRKPEEVIGRSLRAVKRSEFTLAADAAEWHAMTTGEPREIFIRFHRADGTHDTYLHRAHRIGEPGEYFLALTFDRLPEPVVTVDHDSLFELVTTEAGLAFKDNAMRNKAALRFFKVAYLGTVADEASVQEQATRFSVQVVFLHSIAELAAFLPEAAKAGIRLDLICISPEADPGAKAIAIAAGIRSHNVERDIDPLTQIVAAVRPGRHEELLLATPGKQAQAQVLAIDASELGRRVMGQILESLGVSHSLAANGEEALQSLAQIMPRVVFVAPNLPDLDLAAFLVRLRQLVVDGGEMPAVIGIVSDRDDSQKASCHRVGLCETVSKPLSAEGIDQMLRRHLLRRTDPDAAIAANKPAA